MRLGSAWVVWKGFELSAEGLFGGRVIGIVMQN